MAATRSPEAEGGSRALAGRFHLRLRCAASGAPPHRRRGSSVISTRRLLHPGTGTYPLQYGRFPDRYWQVRRGTQIGTGRCEGVRVRARIASVVMLVLPCCWDTHGIRVGTPVVSVCVWLFRRAYARLSTCRAMGIRVGIYAPIRPFQYLHGYWHPRRHTGT
eukprot:2187215-Rhodomonas_salina.1